MTTTPAAPADPFAFHIGPQTCLARAATAAARPILSKLLGLGRLRDLYRDAARLAGPTGVVRPLTFEACTLQLLNVRLRVHASAGAAIPPTGPLIVAANHPTGALDGLALIEAIRAVRSDVRLLANHLLARIPELAESCFFVDPFGGADARSRSLSGMRAAHLWLRRGGVLVVFPAGEVAWQRDRETDVMGGNRTPVDSQWDSSVGRLALATAASVLPVYLTGHNSRFFYFAGRVHPRLRTVLLGRELLRHRRSTVHLRLASPLKSEALRIAAAPVPATALIREQVELQAHRGHSVRSPIADPIDRAVVSREIAALPATATLLTSGVYDVLCADAASIPSTLREIGRLRERTFREVGEGTGQAIDLDRFDDHYQHLFVWNRYAQEIVGAYRVGATDRILTTHGAEGLYTSTLFRYDDRVLQRLNPALELGRSFVRAEYQRSYAALALLWKGIGQIVLRSPRYRTLFGPVSISNRYRDTSQQLLRAFLAQQRDSNIAELIQGVQPPTSFAPPERGAISRVDIDGLDAAIRRMEGGAGMPVLLRQYLQLNASLLGFNVDPAFGDALDALMMVDLTRVPVRTLQRYLGRRDAATFLAHHQRETDRPVVAA